MGRISYLASLLKGHDQEHMEFDYDHRIATKVDAMIWQRVLVNTVVDLSVWLLLVLLLLADNVQRFLWYLAEHIESIVIHLMSYVCKMIHDRNNCRFSDSRLRPDQLVLFDSMKVAMMFYIHRLLNLSTNEYVTMSKTRAGKFSFKLKVTDRLMKQVRSLAAEKMRTMAFLRHRNRSLHLLSHLKVAARSPFFLSVIINAFLVVSCVF